MPAFLTEPVTFSAGRRWLEQKVPLPTTMSAAEISLKLPAKIRGQAFVSAKVAEVHVLQAMQKEAQAIARGDYNYAEGRLRLKEFLSKQGLGIPAPGSAENKDLTELGSTARLDLILRQNVAMAHAVGQREVAENPAVMEYLPNYEYLAEMDKNTRPEHAKFNGLVLPKKDPFWKTHFPPWDYRCRCMAIDTDAPTNGKTANWKPTPEGDQTGVVDYQGHGHQALPSKSGFTFRSDPEEAFTKPDFSSIEDAALRAQVEQAWQRGPWAPSFAAAASEGRPAAAVPAPAAEAKAQPDAAPAQAPAQAAVREPGPPGQAGPPEKPGAGFQPAAAPAPAVSGKPLSAKKLAARVRAVGAEIAHEANEIFVVLGKDGRELFKRFTSGPEGGDPPREWIGNMAGAEFVHNHPSGLQNHGFGTSFSWNDVVKCAAPNDLAGINVVSPRRSYRMAPGPGGWLKPSTIRECYDRHDAIVWAYLKDRIVNLMMPEWKANQAHNDLVWRRVAKELGMKYTVVRR